MGRSLRLFSQSYFMMSAVSIEPEPTLDLCQCGNYLRVVVDFSYITMNDIASISKRKKLSGYSDTKIKQEKSFQLSLFSLRVRVIADLL